MRSHGIIAILMVGPIIFATAFGLYGWAIAISHALFH